MPSSKNDVWVGLFVLIGGLALAFLALQSANLLSLSFQPTYQVTARFDNIGGLKPKAAVKSAGVVVGRVEGKLHPVGPVPACDHQGDGLGVAGEQGEIDTVRGHRAAVGHG